MWIDLSKMQNFKLTIFDLNHFHFHSKFHFIQCSFAQINHCHQGHLKSQSHLVQLNLKVSNYFIKLCSCQCSLVLNCLAYFILRRFQYFQFLFFFTSICPFKVFCQDYLHFYHCYKGPLFLNCCQISLLKMNQIYLLLIEKYLNLD
jgi:hypothetical protein